MNDLDRWARDHRHRAKRAQIAALKKKRVRFRRILTPKFTKEVGELRVFDADIRNVLSTAVAAVMSDEMEAREWARLSNR